MTIEDKLAVVGARWDDENGEGSGSAYFFSSVNGEQLEKLLPTDGAVDAYFGFSVAIDNGMAAVGALGGMANGINSGLAYLFSAPQTECSADLTGDGMLNFFDVSAFLTAFNKMNPAADFTNDGQFNFFDVSAFLQAFAQGCP